ncbi:DUF4179 domain-containing protein [Paenibacillus sp. 481]|uniref:DUF4179 domain-containing protein n=1 Tax=Paenibacillus sp. 481 TaxID=2835869 RepID=UPI001E598DD8|nr:DUF4179 domain-containing protein [Paenibacillus sp. 481]UHA73379.1 DUF4179 domain-containing protein [Paenibacillus sp. 481]
MNTIEEKLQEYKQTWDAIHAPSELEDRLRNALQRVPAKKRNRNKVKAWVTSAAAALILIVGAYEYPALAYYGSKLFNNDELSSHGFSEVAEQGYGQKINKSTTLKDGTVFTINGVIADDNAFLMYYTIDRPAGTQLPEHIYNHYGFDSLQGFWTDSKSRGGSGGDGNSKSQFVGVHEFEPVSPFSRTLTVTFFEWLENGEKVSYPLSFKFEANKAMKSIVKQDLSASIAIDQGVIHYDSITASPTSTFVKGHYELEQEGRSIRSGKTKLYVNGTEVESRGMSVSGTQFELEFAVFPTDKIESIELKLVNFGAYHKVKEPISLASPSDRSIKVGDEKLWIRSVTQTTSGYDIVIARDQFLCFVCFEHYSLSIQADGNVVPVSSISKARPWDLKNGNVLWENTYSFKTTVKPEFLLMDGFQYIKTYNKKVAIPVHIER